LELSSGVKPWNYWDEMGQGSPTILKIIAGVIDQQLERFIRRGRVNKPLPWNLWKPRVFKSPEGIEIGK